MADVGAISGATDPYAATSYSAGSNDKNTLTITSYFKLLAAQLANQDMSNPMSNSEMLEQMTQMAMVQSLTAMTESIQTSSAVSTQTYAAGLVGQEVTVVVLGDKDGESDVPVGVKYGKVEAVDFTNSTPVFILEGDKKTYPLSHILGMGKIPDPYTAKTDEEDETNTKAAGSAQENNSNPLYDPSLAP